MEDFLGNILIVDQQESDFLRLQAMLQPYQCCWISDINLLPSAAIAGTHDVIVLANQWPFPILADTLNSALKQECQTPIIVVSPTADPHLEKMAVRIGAADYFQEIDLTPTVLNRALRYSLQRKNRELQLNRLAYYDNLTGIPNRILFHNRLEHAVAKAERDKSTFALLYIDLNGFKQVNDNYGHDVGDELIRICAQRLLSITRRSDSPARLSGDEFVLLLEKIDTVNIAHIAQKVITSFNQPFLVNSRSITIGCSIGIAVYPEGGADADSLMHNADMAMYQAKTGAESKFHFFTESMGKRVKSQLQLEAQLRQAIRLQEFCLHYQPRVDIATGNVRGLEALIRWQHPQRGLLPPDDFIPLAESTGLIEAIGYWVIRQACNDMAYFSQLGIPPFIMAINLSVRQFKDPKLVERILGIFQDLAIEPRQIEFELTETAISENIELVKLCMLPLAHVGCQFALDDFGTGYSSFVQLQRLPINTIKVDKRFIDEMVTKQQDASLVLAMIEMAHTLGKTVIAEGVEHRQQSSLLKSYGCDETQGFFYCQPLARDSILQCFETTTTDSALSAGMGLRLNKH